MSMGMNLEEAMKTIKFQNGYIMQLSKEKCALQAKIDSLMLEYCPDEMTKEQIENYKDCCSQSNIVYVTNDTFNTVLDTIESPPSPTKELVELLSRK